MPRANWRTRSKAYTEAIRIGQELVTKDQGNATLRRFLSNILANLSDVLFQLTENDNALTALNRSVNLKRRLNVTDADNATWDYELSLALVKLGQQPVRAQEIRRRLRLVQ